MAVSITLTKAVHHTRRGTYCLNFTAVAFGCSSKIFAIEVLPKTADPRNPHVRFSHVCSPAELVEFPADEPAYGSCYFRTDSVEFIFDNMHPVEHVTRNMRRDVKYLEDELNELGAMGCGCAHDDSDDEHGCKSCRGFRIDAQGPLSLRPETADEGYVFYDNVAGDLYIWQDGAWSDPVRFRGPAGMSLPDGPAGYYLQKTEDGVQWVKVETGLDPEALSEYYTSEQVNELLADKQELLSGGTAGQVLTLAEDGKTLVWKDPEAPGDGDAQILVISDVLPDGGTAGQVLTIAADGKTPEWRTPAVPADGDAQILVVSDVLPDGGAAGQVLTISSDGKTPEWQTPEPGAGSDQVLVVSDILPSGGTAGQVLTVTGPDNYEWVDVNQLVNSLIARIAALEKRVGQ